MRQSRTPSISRIFFIGLVITAFSSQLQATSFNFEEHTINSPLPLIAPAFAADVIAGQGQEILTLVNTGDGERALIVYQLNSELSAYVERDRVTIDQQFHTYDVSESQSGELQSVLFLSSHQLGQYQWGNESAPSAIVPIKKLNTLILKDRADFLARGHFIKNINQDSWPDLIIQDFESVQVFIGSSTGFTLQTLPIKAEIIVGNRGATYANPSLYLADVNQNGRLDLIKVETGKIQVFDQQTNGTFATQPTYIPINSSINGTEWWYKRDSNGEELDQSDLTYRKVDELKDINNDALPDMIVRYTQSAGVLDRSNDYEIYLGKLEDGHFGFAEKSNSVIKAEGTLSGIEFFDLNKDGIDEVMLSGFHIGISQIIGALLSGSINQDVLIFQQDENANFKEKPIAKENVDLKFSLSSGRSGNAVVALADITGDGRKELLLSKNTKALSIYSTNSEGNGFLRKPKKYEIRLPEDSKSLSTQDINGDGREDIVFNYSKLDDPTLIQTIKILIAN